MRVKLINNYSILVAALHPEEQEQDDVIRITRHISLPRDVHDFLIYKSGIRIDSILPYQPAILCESYLWTEESATAKSSLFNVVMPNASLTIDNVAIHGGYFGWDELGGSRKQRCGITVKKGSVSVLNSTLTGWPHSAIKVNSRGVAVVSNCTITNCNQHRLGYGISVYGGQAIVSGCFFSNCRHAIAGGNNAPTTVYTFTNNVVSLAKSPCGVYPKEVHYRFYHSIDAHGSGSDGTPYPLDILNLPPSNDINDDYDSADNGGVAGDRLEISHNRIFLPYDDGKHNMVPGVDIRGEPVTSCTIRNNFFVGFNSPSYIRIPSRADRRKFRIYGNKSRLG